MDKAVGISAPRACAAFEYASRVQDGSSTSDRPNRETGAEERKKNLTPFDRTKEQTTTVRRRRPHRRCHNITPQPITSSLATYFFLPKYAAVANAGKKVEWGRWHAPHCQGLVGKRLRIR